jgi:hypothetical protein
VNRKIINIRKILDRNPERGLFGAPKCRQEDNIKMDNLRSKMWEYRLD